MMGRCVPSSISSRRRHPPSKTNKTLVSSRRWRRLLWIRRWTMVATAVVSILGTTTLLVVWWCFDTDHKNNNKNNDNPHHPKEVPYKNNLFETKNHEHESLASSSLKGRRMPRNLIKDPDGSHHANTSRRRASREIVELHLDHERNLSTQGARRRQGREMNTIRLELFSQQAPDSARYIRELMIQQKNNGNSNHSTYCDQCNIYRAEPVPSYWGSPNYPDRYFDGGRWGPPYALVQGQFVPSSASAFSSTQKQGTGDGGGANNMRANRRHYPPVRPAHGDTHKPVIQRGMVAWAGGKDGGPHFFIALANHPEWGHGHVVWAKVLEEENDNDDMALVDAIVQQPLRQIVHKQPPNVMYLETPIPFSISRLSSSSSSSLD